MRIRLVVLALGLMPVAPALADPQTPEQTAATVAVIRETLAQSNDPLVIEFASFQTIPADQLFKQDTGYPAQTGAAPEPAPPAAQVAPQVAFDPSVVATPRLLGRRPRIDVAGIAEAINPELARNPQIERLTQTISEGLIRKQYSKRRVATITRPPPPDYEKVYRDWYLLQIPQSLQPGPPGGPTDYRVLYLSECWANDFPEGLDNAMGNEAPAAEDRPAIDRARIEAALEREQVNIAPIDPFALRMTGETRAAPDPDIRAYNTELARLYREGKLQKPTLVLEKFCGSKMSVMYSIHAASAPLYQISLPAGVSNAWISPLLFAEICNRNTGSRYFHKTCPKWRGFPDNGILSGIGGYRLVGLRGEAVVSYRYEVKPRTPSETPVGFTPIPVTLSLEP